MQGGSGLTTYGYDAQSRLTTIANPYGERTSLSYDALDREQMKVLANGVFVSHTHDAAGREVLLEQRQAAGSAVAVYTATYDNVGNRLSNAEMDGSRVTYSHDASYQLTREQRSGANAFDVAYSYDGAGNRLSKSASLLQVTSYSYDAANALTTVTPPLPALPANYSYDANGNRSGCQRSCKTDPVLNF